MIDRFISRFGKKEIAVLHSKLSVGERHDEWERIRKNEAKIVIGARSAIFAPMNDIGIIIIDEEHDSSYKSEADPKYNAKEVAKYIAKQSKADLVIGNFKCIYENDKKEKKNNAIFTSGAMYNHVFRDEDVINCVHFQCIEGNKLWNTEMISHCGVRFQNTCISSDFIFYHQCLGYCKVVATISDKILLRHIYSDSNSKKNSDVITSKTPFEMILDGYKKAGRENFAAEIQKDELIYILDELKKIPEYDTKEIRKKVFESLTEIDFDSSLFSTEEEKKMIKQYKKIKAGKWWYVSDIRAAIRR